jgi:hypothetical protein
MKRTGAVAFLALALTGCAANYVEQGGGSGLVVIASLNNGAALQSSVKLPITPDNIDVTVENRAKNPNVTASAPNDVRIERYEVRYLRSDNRNVEGVDVPYRISGNVAVSVAYNGNTTFSLEIVRAQAKLEPPLRNLRVQTPDLNEFGGGAVILTCIAEVTLHGRTIAGQAVQAVGRMQIDFAQWGADGA